MDSGRRLAAALVGVGTFAGVQAQALAETWGELDMYRSELDAVYKRAWWEGVERLSNLEIELEKLIISDSRGGVIAPGQYRASGGRRGAESVRIARRARRA